MTAIARFLNWLSALWVLLLAAMILTDIAGRILFGTPLQGTTEIVRNSVVAIAFLQLPAAGLAGSMLRTEVLSESCGPRMRLALRIANALAGFALFVLIVAAGWGEMLLSVRIGEYEGEGALRVPVWPVRILLAASAAVTAVCYLLMAVADLRGRLEDELAYPGMGHAPSTTGEGA